MYEDFSVPPNFSREKSLLMQDLFLSGVDKGYKNEEKHE